MQTISYENFELDPIWILIAVYRESFNYIINYAIYTNTPNFYTISSTIDEIINKIMPSKLLIKSNETYCRKMFESKIKNEVGAINKAFQCYKNYLTSSNATKFKYDVCGGTLESMTANISKCVNNNNATTCVLTAIDVRILF